MRDLPQELVARLVPERIVDELEAIEVEKQHREKSLLTAAHAVDRPLQALEEQGAVGQARELVMARGVRQLVLHRLALRNILHDRPDDLASQRVRHADAGQQHRVGAAVLAQVLLLVGPVASRVAHALQLRLLRFGISARRDVPVGHAEQLFPRVATGGDERVVNLQVAARVQLVEGNANGRQLKQ